MDVNSIQFNSVFFIYSTFYNQVKVGALQEIQSLTPRASLNRTRLTKENHPADSRLGREGEKEVDRTERMKISQMFVNPHIL